ncbi:WD40-repeat-containing domain protein [Dipodascopsis tothii]|uniref:WD40-repeat-containing domain protein n=1 Tax=Dipodascopsis tothii TaxID=44089 RepID=UPI0034CD4FDA
MPSRDNIHVLVARYLRDNRYAETLKAFQEEIGLEDNMIPTDDSMTLESIVDHNRRMNLAQDFAAISLEDDSEKWVVPHPQFKTMLPAQMPETNILFVTVATLAMPSVVDDPTSPLYTRPCILTTSADKSLRIFDFYTLDLLRKHTHLHLSPLLSLLIYKDNMLITGGMDGRLVISRADTGDIVHEVKDHLRFVVRIACSKDQRYIATAGYDQKVYVYEIVDTPATDEAPAKVELVKIGVLTFPSNPEALAFTDPDLDGGAYVDAQGARSPMLIVSRRDWTFIYYYKIQPTLTEYARHNLNPDSNSWVTFCAMDIVLDPSNPKYIAIATSATPHMRFMMLEAGNDQIIKNVTTNAPQDAYSSGRICWRPHGSGVWCNGNDGVIRGIERSTGEVVAELKHHDGKVKAMYAGVVDGKEVLVTGGFDKTVVVWETEKR